MCVSTPTLVVIIKIIVALHAHYTHQASCQQLPKGNTKELIDFTKAPLYWEITALDRLRYIVNIGIYIGTLVEVNVNVSIHWRRCKWSTRYKQSNQHFNGNNIQRNVQHMCMCLCVCVGECRVSSVVESCDSTHFN